MRRGSSRGRSRQGAAVGLLRLIAAYCSVLRLVALCCGHSPARAQPTSPTLVRASPNSVASRENRENQLNSGTIWSPNSVGPSVPEFSCFSRHEKISFHGPAPARAQPSSCCGLLRLSAYCAWAQQPTPVRLQSDSSPTRTRGLGREDSDERTRTRASWSGSCTARALPPRPVAACCGLLRPLAACCVLLRPGRLVTPLRVAELLPATAGLLRLLAYCGLLRLTAYCGFRLIAAVGLLRFLLALSCSLLRLLAGCRLSAYCGCRLIAAVGLLHCRLIAPSCRLWRFIAARRGRHRPGGLCNRRPRDRS